MDDSNVRKASSIIRNA
ncbi:hypothetical protein VTO73DRAFT_15529 [Trametes versicolor]